MPADKAKQVLQRELGVKDLSEVFEWINLDKPIGSASISQVTCRLALFDVLTGPKAHAASACSAQPCWCPSCNQPTQMGLAVLVAYPSMVVVWCAQNDMERALCVQGW